MDTKPRSLEPDEALPITPQMIEAGVKVLRASESTTQQELVCEIYFAMRALEPEPKVGADPVPSDVAATFVG